MCVKLDGIIGEEANFAQYTDYYPSIRLEMTGKTMKTATRIVHNWQMLKPSTSLLQPIPGVSERICFFLRLQ
jgi:hypothetical protein